MIEFGELIGKTIEKIFIDEKRWHLQFQTNSGEGFVYRCSGSCCNDVWFHHISGVEFLIGHEIFGIDVKGWNDVEPTIQECEEAGFWTLRTTGGWFDIEVRNSHNGYYGGNVEFVGINQIVDAEQITEDF